VFLIKYENPLQFFSRVVLIFAILMTVIKFWHYSKRILIEYINNVVEDLLTVILAWAVLLPLISIVYSPLWFWIFTYGVMYIINGFRCSYSYKRMKKENNNYYTSIFRRWTFHALIYGISLILISPLVYFVETEHPSFTYMIGILLGIIIILITLHAILDIEILERKIT